MGHFSSIYNPCDESTNQEQVVAARWELLRRNVRFQQLAQQWVESREFRIQHADTPEYHDQKVHFPRCALDWMLTPPERVEVLRVQEVKNHIFVDPRFVFGPVELKRTTSELETMKKRGCDCHRIKPCTWHNLLKLEDSWRMAPAPFKAQFRFAVQGDIGFQKLREQFAELGSYLQWAAHRLASDVGDAQRLEITEKLFNAGSWFDNLAEHHRIFALPNATYTPNGLKHQFEQILDDFKASGQFDRRAQYSRQKNFLGSAEDWKWFLTAEKHGLDWRKSADLYRLAQLYTDQLKPRPGKPNRANVKTYGGIDQPSKSTLVKNRRSTVANHCRGIHTWIDKQYPVQC
jgi:hypothetical protein